MSDPLQGLIGSGQVHVRTVAGLAQAAAHDGEPSVAVRMFASLGAFGACPSNEERDLHRWLKDLYGISLEVYYFPLRLHVPQNSKKKRHSLMPYQV